MAYSVHIKNFDGPLDLLLSLVSSAKVEIQDIFISEITEQYLSLMEQTAELDMETASEFLTTASDLLYIKSRSLLPKKEQEEDIDEDGLTPEERFTRKLLEYKAYKEISEKLKDFEKKGMLSVYKLPEEILKPDSDDIDLSDFALSAELIASAFNKAYSRLIKKRATLDGETELPIMRLVREEFNVETQMKKIMSFLSIMPKLKFEDFLNELPTREELCVTFSAMLELLHNGRIHAVQEENFGEIYIEKIITRKDK